MINLINFIIQDDFMTIKQLKYLLEIEKQGSFNRASKSLFVTQPNITKVIKSLEDELGVNLIFRKSKTRYVIFTPEGKELLEYARSLTEQFKMVEDSFKNIRTKFCITSQHYSFVVEAFIKEILKNKDDKFECTLMEGKLQNVIDDVLTRKSSIGFMAIYDNEHSHAKKTLEDKGLVFTPIKKIVPHVFIRKNHPLANNSIISKNNLKKYPAVFFDQEVTALNFCGNTRNKEDYNKLIKVTDRDTIYSIIKSTDAYNIGSGVVNKCINEEIIVKPLDCDFPQMEIGYISLKTFKINKRVAKFVDTVKQILDEKY